MKSKIVKKILSGILSVSLIFQMGTSVVYGEESNQTAVAGSKLLSANAAEGMAQLSGTLDLSYGYIRFEDNGGKLDITYTPENGGTKTTIKGQDYQKEYEIIQSNSTTIAPHSINFKNTKDFVNVKLNGVNMLSKPRAINLENAKAKLNLSGTNTITVYDPKETNNSTYMGIHAGTGSELTIDGSGSLEVKNPTQYGVGIGGEYKGREISEGAGIIRIQGGTLNVSGIKGAAIGSGYRYQGDDPGSIYITGGTVVASINKGSEIGGAAIGGSCLAKPANVYITGGKVIARAEGSNYSGGAAIGSGENGVSGGKVVISGGYVEAQGTTGIGGGCKGTCPDITISGGTIKATGIVTSIGTATWGSGGSLRISGGTISTINNEKPTINLTSTKDGTIPVYYTTVNVNRIYGKDASVNNASITGCDYSFKDVKTDANGFLHLYLQESAAGMETKASFNNVNYSGIITGGDSNVLKTPAVFMAEADTITGTGASLHAAYEGSGIVYYVTSSTELTTGSEVENASGVQNMTMSDGIASTILSGLKEKTEYTYYLVVKTGDVYSNVVPVTFITKRSSNLQSIGTVDGKISDNTPISHSTAKGDLFTWNSEGTISFTYFIDNNGTKTTAANSGATSEGAAPKNEGNYYLKATLSENGEYAGAESEYIQFTIKPPLSGTGKETDPYIIKTAVDLAYLANSVRAGENYSGKYFKLNNDITYSSMPIGCFTEGSSTNTPFCGNFDGAGHTVTLAMTNDSDKVQAVALFGYLGSGASVKNINTTGTITSSGKYSGGIAGVARDGAVNISNCSSNVEMNYTPGGDSTYGGIVGLINNSGNVTMTNCCFTGKITTTASSKNLEGVGGLCGWKDNEGTLNAANCYVNASFVVNDSVAMGKHMARNGGTFTNCYYNKEKMLRYDSSTSSTGNQAVTNDFTSGKIAWLLQQGQSDLAIKVWGQTLTGDKKDSNPVLSSDSAKVVHKISYYQGHRQLDNGSYVNNNTKIILRQISDLTPDEGYDVKGWYKGNYTTTILEPGSEQLITSDIISDIIYHLCSVKKIFYTIDTQSNDSKLGTVEKGGKYVAGATVTLKAKPRMGCKFEKWSSDAEGNNVVSTEKTLEIIAKNSSTYYAWFTKDKYKLTVGDFNSSEGTVSGVKEDGYSYNEKADLTAEAKAGYAFDGWKNEYGVTVDTNSNFSFKVSGNMTITPIFTQIKENTTYYTAAFYHQSGDLLKSEKVAANSNVTPPNTPSKIGYEFIGWSVDGKNPVELNPDRSITITSNIILKPLFKANEVKYSLTVNGIQATYSPLSSVTSQANTQEGKQFAYWKDGNDKIVSYSNPYNFSLSGDITLTAVYEDTTKAVIKKPTLTLSATTYEVINPNKHKMVWYAAMDLPEGYTLVESGILRMLSTTAQTNEQMTFETNGIYRRIIQVSKSIPNQYYYSVAASDGKGVSVRAYIVVKDKDGNLETIFSDVQHGCYK